MSLAFVNSPLDRCSNLRTDHDLIADLRQRPQSLLLRMVGDGVVYSGDKPQLENDGGAATAMLLGRDLKDRHWFATRVEAAEDVRPLRGLAIDGLHDSDEVSIMAQARSILHWHERHGFCANCGAATEMADAGYRRHCTSCNADHFPRTDPVIIIAVRKGTKFLLGRQTSWTPGMFSTLAGFMEPGETIEQAARREVLEESGIVVGEIRYLTSQPWPFPTNLMIGLIGEALTDTITVDPKELETARWFEADELKLMLARQHPEGLWATHPAAIAHHLLKTAVEEV